MDAGCHRCGRADRSRRAAPSGRAGAGGRRAAPRLAHVRASRREPVGAVRLDRPARLGCPKLADLQPQRDHRGPDAGRHRARTGRRVGHSEPEAPAGRMGLRRPAARNAWHDSSLTTARRLRRQPAARPPGRSRRCALSARVVAKQWRRNQSSDRDTARCAGDHRCGQARGPCR